MTQHIAFSDLLYRTLAGAAFALSAHTATAEPNGQEIYADLCAACHAESRLGGTGPALIPEALARLRGGSLTDLIANGRVATQMPAFHDTLSEAEIAAVAAYIKTDLPDIPRWTAQEIEETRSLSPEYTPVTAPAFDADPMNITLVVETGDHHVSVLDGDTFEVLDRFATPFAVHGGPKFSPDGHYVYVMSRDGWVQKYDIWALEEVGRVRAGVNSRNIAMSSDGLWLAVANYLPHTLTILSTDDLSVAQVIPIEAKGGQSSRVAAVYQAPQRDSFILSLKDAAEIWEISTRTETRFTPRRISVSAPLDDFFFTPDYSHLIGANREAETGVVVGLESGTEEADLPLPGMPHLGSGISFISGGKRVMATPHLSEGLLSVIDMDNWTILKEIETAGPGFFLRSHENTPYLWADVFFGPNKDKLHIIDKESLEIIRTLSPAPGKTVAHIEFTRDGRYALVSIWEEDGAVIVYDAATLEEVTRLPMKKPSGKYNVWNKITFSDGTSH